MLSDRIDGTEHLFHATNLVTKVDTDAAPNDPYTVPLASGRAFRPPKFNVSQDDRSNFWVAAAAPQIWNRQFWTR